MGYKQVSISSPAKVQAREDMTRNTSRDFPVSGLNQDGTPGPPAPLAMGTSHQGLAQISERMGRGFTVTAWQGSTEIPVVVEDGIRERPLCRVP